ncbi:DUF3857 domain-containing protein [Flagellimonas lutaonensis]|uniref:Conserved hypothetical periplasmic protein n=1 Tax=Flagellimonas lutaonensis TaxID=516051 RepID=A0A0D5YRM0_9FLAO|nr:DUF3857 domain-containing protein [Allomuricauda lutaonensis]AKA34922.1 Conserved hypothetical periplasmic protein [Allomuricauda lutaonensis]
MLYFRYRIVSKAIFFITIFYANAQSSNPKTWEYLLNNQRQEALKTLKKGKPKSIEELITRQIVQNENGIFKTQDNFIAEFKLFTDFEYYLYAFWNRNFLFDEYTKSGFNNKNIKHIDSFDIDEISQNTTKEALRYLKSIVARSNNDWNLYYKLNAQIPVLKHWQYCGSFENLNGGGLDIVYPPEQSAHSDKGFDANSNGTINWYEDPNRAKEAYQFYSNHKEYGSAVNYAQTFIENDHDQRVLFKIGASAEVKVWLNNVPIFEKKENRFNDIDAYSVELTLPKGVNRLLVKCSDVSTTPYFIARFTDLEHKPLKSIKSTARVTTYNEVEADEIGAVVRNHPVEHYFKKKWEQNQDDFFYALSLISTYLRNSKYQEAKPIILRFLQEYPQSSMLKVLLKICYELEGDDSSADELAKNIILDDEDYYLSYVFRMQDYNSLFKLPIDEFEKYVQGFEQATDFEILKKTTKLLLSLRKQDKLLMESQLDNIFQNHSDQLNLLKAYADLYKDFLGKEEKAVAFYENVNKRYFDYPALLKLAGFYDRKGEKEKLLTLFEENRDHLSMDNGFLFDYGHYLQKYKRYEKLERIMLRALENFPYSFRAMQYLGESYYQRGDKDKALHYFKKHLEHNGGNTSVRKKIEELTKTDGLLEDLKTNNIYKYVDDNRGIQMHNNYGYNYLLDESLVQLYEQGGGKSIIRYLVEITSDNGVELLKEINLGLNGSYTILKAELIKSDGSLNPASRNGSNMVFKNIEVGDVIYIDYTTTWSNTGRFFNDYVDYYQFDSYHPALKRKYVLLTPKNKPIFYTNTNGAVDVKINEINDFLCYTWQLNEVKPMPQQEDYMPSTSDLFRNVHISTIENWDEIANWYKDLVRPQIKINEEVKKAFEEIFPNGPKGLSDNEKAEQIYRYISNNVNYSHVSFRQSGFIPQKPARTLSTKLGDCKDLSTLYMVLADMAGLKSHLVLVLTSDYGRNSMVLPSQDFNHCIVKVVIDGKNQYLELTDKNLPFRSIPSSLEYATLLDIPNENFTNVRQGIYLLEKPNKLNSMLDAQVELSLSDNYQEMRVKSTVQGEISSGYIKIFRDNNYRSIKKSISDDFQARLTNNIVLDSVYNISKDLGSSELIYEASLTLNTKMDNFGETKLFKLPLISHPYSSSIVNYSERKYPIEYVLYENVDRYVSTYFIVVGKGKEFVQIPEDVRYSFKNHSFELTYKLYPDGKLEVKSIANTPRDRITVKDYEEFKKYVLKVLDARERVIGLSTKVKPTSSTAPRTSQSHQIPD